MRSRRWMQPWCISWIANIQKNILYILNITVVQTSHDKEFCWRKQAEKRWNAQDTRSSDGSPKKAVAVRSQLGGVQTIGSKLAPGENPPLGRSTWLPYRVLFRGHFHETRLCHLRLKRRRLVRMIHHQYMRTVNILGVQKRPL